MRLGETNSADDNGKYIHRVTSKLFSRLDRIAEALEESRESAISRKIPANLKSHFRPNSFVSVNLYSSYSPFGIEIKIQDVNAESLVMTWYDTNHERIAEWEFIYDEKLNPRRLTK